MLNCKKQESGVRSKESGRIRVPRIIVFCLLPTAYCLLFSGCRRDMQDQPKAIAYRENSFYKDGTGSRPLVEGTVPRGYLRENRSFFFGKKLIAGDLNREQQNQQAPQPSPTTVNAYSDDVDTIPMQITKTDLDRGQE